MKHQYSKFTKYLFSIVALGLTSFILIKEQKKPVLYIIGDSTVQNNDGKGGPLWGWGTLLRDYIDTNRISISNHAKSGTSSRTFMNGIYWTNVINSIKPGDYMIMQFGHNDGGALDDTARARGTIKGTGEETKDIFNPITKQPETVHTYGWYMRKMVNDAKAKGATVIICSLVPRDKWKDGNVVVEEQYPYWAEETAKTTGAYYINLNNIIAKHWIEIGQDKVNTFFVKDHTHTNLEGAQLNASCVIEGLKLLDKCPLNDYLKRNN